MSSTDVKTQNPAKEHLLHHIDDSSDGIGIGKPRLEADDQNDAEEGTAQEQQPPGHYRLRAFVAISIPTIVTAYYGVVWAYLVHGIASDEAVKYRTFSASLFFYAWFIIGVFALSWSKYGLVGVEAAMLLRSRWAAPDLVALLMHSDSTWSGPSGWFVALRRRKFYRLWSLLALVSFFPFVAIPLSGLVFELSDGYIKTSDTPSVQGRNSTTFNQRYDHGFIITSPAQHAWSIGSVPTIPGFGVIYTNGSVDRSDHSDFQKLPNTLPLSESIPDLFLVPQADKPVSGTAWGLRIKYDCSIVRSVSEFTVLSEKATSSIQDSSCGLYLKRNCINLKTPSGNMISLWNTTVNKILNVEAYYEVGISGPRMKMKYHEGHPDFEAEEGNTSLVFEYAAWQYRTTHITFDDLDFPFNATVEPFIEGMSTPFIKSDNDTYAVNRTFFAFKGDMVDGVSSERPSTDASDLVPSYKFNSGQSQIIDVAPPIGVRCVASSGLGTADLDGVTSTFRSFQRSDPFVDPTYEYGPDRFGYTAQMILRSGEFYQHYISGGLSGHQPNQNGNRYPQFVDGLSLLRSVNLAYALDAFDLMYGVTSGFRREWPEPRLTSSRKGKVLTVASLISSAAVGYLVLALLCAWAALSAGLAAWYGFRRRPADRLDGYAMLRRGADMAGELKADRDFMDGKPFYDSRTLTTLRCS